MKTYDEEPRDRLWVRPAGTLAAGYLAISYLVGMVLFLVVLRYPEVTTPEQKLALLQTQGPVLFWTNLLLYVVFGPTLAVLVLAIRNRIGSPGDWIRDLASVIGFVWAGCLVASGMVVNAGMGPVLALARHDPGQAALAWTVVEAVASGLGNGNGEILGGLFTALVSFSAWRSRSLARGWALWGLIIGVVGVGSTLPGLVDLAAVFGLGQMVWFVAWAFRFAERKTKEIL